MDAYTACKKENYMLLVNLIENGHDINANGKLGETLLSIAVKKNNIDLIKYLIKKGADVNLKEIEFKSPLGFAVNSNSIKIAKLLIANGAKLTSFDKRWLGCYAVPIVDLLIKNGLDIDYITQEDLTILHQAVLYNNFKLVDYLIKNGANVNTVTKNGVTPLHTSTYGDKRLKLNIVQNLVENGADINAKTKTGESPLYLANKNRRKDIVDYLQSKGAK